MSEDDVQVCSVCWEELTKAEVLVAVSVGGDLVCVSCQTELNEDDVENTGTEY